MEEANNKNETKIKVIIFGIIATIWCLFHLYTSFYGAFRPLIQGPTFVFFGITACFIIHPLVKNKSSKWFSLGLLCDLLLIALGLITCSYVLINEEQFLLSVGEEPNKIDLLMGTILILLVLEGGRRCIGLALPIMVILAILYGYFGPFIPGAFRHASISLTKIIDISYRTDLGLWGTVTGVGATIIGPFVIFGSLLMLTGAGDTFKDLALKLVGRFRGGGAMVAIVASTLFGMISGSAAANAASIGVFTIPMMKKIGYRPPFAAGVEATSSTGGQLMPPIMGAAAFLMAEMLGVPYIKICIAAAVPAFLYYFSIFMSVVFESRKGELESIPREQIPTWLTCLTPKRIIPLFSPIAVLLYMIINGRSLQISCFWAIITIIFFHCFFNFRNPKKIIIDLYNGAIDAGRTLIIIAILCAVANVFIGLINQTGLGVKFSEVVINWSQGILFWTFFFSMAVAIVLGMGMPTVGAYAVGAAVLSGSLMNLGVIPIVAHLFIFYFTLISAITPPVCPAVFVTAGIAATPWLPAAWIAIRIGLSAFIIPFGFVYNTDLLLGIGSGDIIAISLTFIKLIIAIIFLSSAGMYYFKNPLNWWQCALLIIGGLLLVFPQVSFNWVGLGMGIIAMSSQFVNARCKV